MEKLHNLQSPLVYLISCHVILSILPSSEADVVMEVGAGQHYHKRVAIEWHPEIDRLKVQVGISSTNSSSKEFSRRFSLSLPLQKEL